MGSVAIKQDHKNFTWDNLAGRFSGDRDCLASYLALAAAEVVAGVKPANLISIHNRRRPCGRNIYHLWQKYGSSLLHESGLEFLLLIDRKESLLLLIYDKMKMDALLQKESVRRILHKAGYSFPADSNMILQELQTRVTSSSFPHEIGIILGYPLKDVAAFMGLARIRFSCQGPWKIYGEPAESLKLARLHKSSRANMARDLSSCRSPMDCLRSKQLPRLAAKMFMEMQKAETGG